MLTMAPLMNQQHQNVNYLIVGLGLTGYSVASYLLGKGYSCRCVDSRDIAPYSVQLREQFPAVKIAQGSISDELMSWADTLVVSPGVSIHQGGIFRAGLEGKRIIGDIELFAEAVEKPVVAITGSNGKTTVTSLVASILKTDGRKFGVGGNIGTPALDLLDLDADMYVLELSSYQLETTSSLKPAVAVILNISEDHLDRYDGIEAYIAAKHRVYINASKIICNLDDAETMVADCSVGFSLNTLNVSGYSIISADTPQLGFRGQPWLSTAELQISGQHNWANALAAMAICQAIGISEQFIVEGLKAFKGVPHRSQLVAVIDGVEYVNDSKATNVGAARASIEGRNRPVILIAGGQSKSADMTALNDSLKRLVKRVYLLGEDAGIIERAWSSVVDIVRVHSMEEAVQQASKFSRSGDCVLLAPACASLDMYEKFEARGDDFSRLVEALTDVS
ncbi:MAG: UDP-N-acetylmuramoylalanine--D-glutamate ligase [Gammaproteobacteria bacterium]|jgi:UDP-N-acetylmuramoylalanine--D-glutamate ligase